MILLFQKIDGVDTLMFVMYVQEYGHDCPPPNNRSVYISYLDSVKYFKPAKYRTALYHEVLLAYFKYVKNRGFLNGYIWACPPLKGDDYIFYCHPSEQKTPKADRLRKWYIRMIEDSIIEGVTVERTTLYDEHFTGGHSKEEILEATRVPYMEGDYFPGIAEDCIKEMEKEDKLGKSGENAAGSAALHQVNIYFFILLQFLYNIVHYI